MPDARDVILRHIAAVNDRDSAADPWAVDSASGTEREPGVKDPDKVRRFLEAASAASVVA